MQIRRPRRQAYPVVPTVPVAEPATGTPVDSDAWHDMIFVVSQRDPEPGRRVPVRDGLGYQMLKDAPTFAHGTWGLGRGAHRGVGGPVLRRRGLWCPAVLSPGCRARRRTVAAIRSRSRAGTRSRRWRWLAAPPRGRPAAAGCRSRPA